MMTDLAIYLHIAISLSTGFFFRSHHLWLFMSPAHIYSIGLCKHPLFKLMGGKELVWGLLRSTSCQVISLGFAILMWINIELLCVRKQFFIFKTFLNLRKNCSQVPCNCDYRFGLIWTGSKLSKWLSVDIVYQILVFPVASVISTHVYVHIIETAHTELQWPIATKYYWCLNLLSYS